MLARVTPELRSTIPASIEIMIVVVVEELKAKISYTEDFPMKCLPVMCPYFGGTILQSKQRYKVSLDWYDSLPAKAICPSCLAMCLQLGRLRDMGQEYLDAAGGGGHCIAGGPDPTTTRHDHDPTKT